MIVKTGLENNKTPKIIYIIISIFVISILFLSLLSNEKIMGVFFQHEETPYETPRKCIEACIENCLERYPDENPDYYNFKSSIYVYENDNQYIELINAYNDRIWCYILDKEFDGEKTTYKYNYSATVSLYDDWSVCTKDYYFKVVENPQSIEKYNGKEPIVTHIKFRQYNEDSEGYLLFVDDSNY